MEILVGTSGWSNPIWNPSGLLWYQKHSRLNALELSMSFYQLPTLDQVKSWAEEGQELTWSVKVNRAITHFFCFNERARDHFMSFRALFAPLDHLVAYYLFQLPPHAHPSMREIIEDFFYYTKLGPRFALEWRNPKWFADEHIDWAKKLGITIVSVDLPAIPRDIINTHGTVYLRLHGRSDWFEHHYSRKELSNIVSVVRTTGCERVLAFLNNDSSQLKNARALLHIFKGPSKTLQKSEIINE